jgi:hypothetical protein
MADGIMQMQAGDAHHFPYGAHLSWRNEWHAWAQAKPTPCYLLGKELGRIDYVAQRLFEVDHFTPT